jgi:hypothetical protein
LHLPCVRYRHICIPSLHLAEEEYGSDDHGEENDDANHQPQRA